MVSSSVPRLGLRHRNTTDSVCGRAAALPLTLLYLQDVLQACDLELDMASLDLLLNKLLLSMLQGEEQGTLRLLQHPLCKCDETHAEHEQEDLGSNVCLILAIQAASVLYEEVEIGAQDDDCIDEHAPRHYICDLLERQDEQNQVQAVELEDGIGLVGVRERWAIKLWNSAQALEELCHMEDLVCLCLHHRVRDGEKQGISNQRHSQEEVVGLQTAAAMGQCNAQVQEEHYRVGYQRHVVKLVKESREEVGAEIQELNHCIPQQELEALFGGIGLEACFCQRLHIIGVVLHIHLK
mmetsp:Transcript_21310/g.45349  ORF Transcript_21310/g.45349 Transcript_21310/m.45349 type:complete len:295 (-) Transcript_21310:89-973(-)